MSKRRGYKRGRPFRDVTTFIIATEGAKREVRYFEALAANQRRIQVKVLGAGKKNDSAPIHTLHRAIDFVTKKNIQSGDQVWLVMDKDRWSDQQLMEVERTCRDKNWNLTISNPCFELWLYLHYADLPQGYTGSCQDLKRDLGTITLPEGYQPATALRNLPAAIQRAKTLDLEDALRIPPAFVSQVYRLAEAMEQFIE